MSIKIKKNDLKQLLTIIIFTIVFLIFDYIGKNNYNLEKQIFGSKYTLGDINYFIFAIVAVVYISFNIRIVIKQTYRYILNPGFILWQSYSLCVLFTSMLTHDSPDRVILNILYVPILSFIILPNKFFINDLEILGGSLILSNIVMLSYYMLATDKGISNAMGIILVTSSMGWIAFINSRIVQRKSMLLGFIFFLLNGIAISLTSSRTAFVAYILSFILVLFIILLLKSSVKSKVKILFIICVIGISIIIFSDVWYGMFENIIDKFIVRRNEANMLSGREDIWNVAFSNVNLFGHGSNFFLDNGFLHAHNSFIAILGIDGFIAIVTFTIFQIKMIYDSLIYYLKNNFKNYSVLPLLINVLFVLISITEDVWYRPYLLSIHLLWFICNGIIISKYVKKGGI